MLILAVVFGLIPASALFRPASISSEIIYVADFQQPNLPKEPFHPIEPGKVRMYVCGMTVYDYCHVGHARVMVVFDVVLRWLRARGYDDLCAQHYRHRR